MINLCGLLWNYSNSSNATQFIKWISMIIEHWDTSHVSVVKPLDSNPTHKSAAAHDTK